MKLHTKQKKEMKMKNANAVIKMVSKKFNVTSAEVICYSNSDAATSGKFKKVELTVNNCGADFLVTVLAKDVKNSIRAIKKAVSCQLTDDNKVMLFK